MAFEALRDYPYGRLAALLEGLTPGRDPVLTHVGDPQGVPPAFVAETITENAALWGRYPPVQGTEAFRQAVADWLNRRYDLPDGMLAPDRHVLSLCGTREGLFQAVLMAVARKRERLPETVRPVVILPNPLYHVYYGAAVMAGAEVVMADATAANGFLPDYHGFPEAVLARTALMFVCSPNNPTGVVTPVRRLECLLELARTHEFILAADECYSEIWFESPPPGLLQCCAAQGGDMSQVLVFNSLSKRSGTPGLRCGFVAGDEGLLQDFFLLRGYGGAQVPGPILAAATALWRDEAHVEETRTRYAGLLAVAAAELDGYPGFPQARRRLPAVAGCRPRRTDGGGAGPPPVDGAGGEGHAGPLHGPPGTERNHAGGCLCAGGSDPDRIRHRRHLSTHRAHGHGRGCVMAATKSKKDKAPFLPEGVAARLSAMVRQGSGLLLLLLAGLWAVLLLSYAPEDPSLNRAGGEAVQNLLGLPGAVAADLALQGVGWAGVLPFFLLLAWGWRILVDGTLFRWLLRVGIGLLAVLLAAVSLAGLPFADGWFLKAGAGGFAGAMLLEVVLSGFAGLLSSGETPQHAALALSLLLLPFLLALLLYALAVPGREWQAVGRVLAWGVRLPLAAVARLRGDGAADKPLPAAKRRPARRQKAAPSPPAPCHPALSKRVAERKAAAKPTAEGGHQIAMPLPDEDGYQNPPLSLLEAREGESGDAAHDKEGLEQNARMLEGVLEDFGVTGRIVMVRPGPVVTLYELEPAAGIKTSRVISLADDIARSMSAVSVRIATVPGRSVIGIELPNARREIVGLHELLASDAYGRTKAKLPVVLGKDIGGTPVVADLSTMPHLLVAGTTGSGKSVGLNAMILSLLYHLPPDQCKFIMVDPKMLELSVYDGVPHLLSPVVTDPRKAVVALKWTVREMENRYRAMSKLSVRNIEGYNQRIARAVEKGEEITHRVQTGFDPETGQPEFEEESLPLDPYPYIVVVVDEMADLMLVAGKEIEASIQRLAQMARAAGIHIIMSTQRPSVDVITGTIKANFPTRISFSVTSKVDSRTILGEQGAEQLLGKGDMLYMMGGGRLVRIHGPFVADSEVEKVCAFLKSQSEPQYVEAVTDEDSMEGGFDTDVSGAGSPLGGGAGSSGDDLYDQAVALVAREGKASTSFVQRHLQIGYNRAARLIEQMEKEGVVSSANHVGRREVLVKDHSGDV